jgi:hypothetical protein
MQIIYEEKNSTKTSKFWNLKVLGKPRLENKIHTLSTCQPLVNCREFRIPQYNK